MELIQMADLFPFTRIVYNSPQNKKVWGQKISRASSVHNKAEFEMVRMGYRKAATMHISPYSYDESIEKIIRNDLVWLPIQRTKNYNGFSHKHFPTDPRDPDSSVYGVLARSIEDAEAFRNASQGQTTDHNIIGDLLGFPQCCRNFFNEVWPKGYFDPIWQAAERTEGAEKVSETHIALKKVYPEAMQVFRYIGPRITSHLSCSFTCEESKKEGQRWVECMEEFDPEGLQAMMDILTLPFKWSVKWGIAIVTTPHFRVITNSVPSKKEYIIEFVEKL